MSLTLRAWATCYLPAGEFELVFDPDRAAHHLDAGLDIGPELQGKAGEAILVGGDLALALDRSRLAIAHQAARP